jgi:hypothetical protein
MNRRLLFATVAAACFAATVATACGGTTGGRPGGIGTSGAALVTADAVGYLAIDSDLSSSQWQQVDDLLKKFPGRDKWLKALDKELASQKIDYERDIKPALGSELDLAVVGSSSASVSYAMLTKPDSLPNAEALVHKLGEGAPSVTRVVDDWLVVASQAATIDSVLKGSGSALADNSRFKDAFGELPDDALAKVYANGTSLTKLVKSQLNRSETATAGDSGNLDWIAASLVAQGDGLELEGDVKTLNGKSYLGPAYASKLISGVPADAIAYATFHGSGAALDQLKQNPMFNQGLRQFEQMLGVSADELAALFAHENVFYVRRGPGIPEFSLVLEAPDTAQTLATLDRLATHVAKLAPARLGHETEDGLAVKTLNFGPVTARWAGFDGRVLLTTSPTGITDYRAGGDKLGDDSGFKDALSGAGVPDKTNGMLYVNVADAVKLAESYAGLAGGKLPRDVESNLEPLRSFVAYGSPSGDLTKFTAFLAIK